MPPKASSSGISNPVIPANNRSAINAPKAKPLTAPAASSSSSNVSASSSTQADGSSQPPSTMTIQVREPPAVSQASRSKASIVVNARQRGNPIIAHIKGVQWEYGDVVPDYVVGLHSCVLYLSLRYHRLHPEYMHQRIEKLRGMYQLRIMLVMCDVNDHQAAIREITKVCLINNMTVMMAWTPEEAGAYLATYKLYEHKSPDILKERVHNDYSSHLNRSLTGVKGINKTDVITLSTSFGTFDRIVHASSEELSLCPGLGDVKVRRLQEAFASRFKPKRKDGPGKKTRDLPRSGLDDEDVSMTGVGEDSVGSPKRKKVDKGKGREMRVDDEKEGSPDWPSDEDEEESGGDGEGVDGEGKRKKNRVMEESDEEDDEDEERKRQERKRERAAQGRQPSVPRVEKAGSPDWESDPDEAREGKMDVDEARGRKEVEEPIIVQPRKPNRFVQIPK